jgi:hypothetical protein
MSGDGPDLTNSAALVHPAVRWRRIQDLLWRGLPVLGALALALYFATSVAKPNLPLTIGFLLGLGALIVLMVSPRLELTVTFLAVFLGCIDGPIKGFLGGGNATAVVRNVLVFGVVLGALARLLSKHERVRLPPMSGWVITYVVLVLVQAFNPNTVGTLKILGGFRQQLEWLPFFFFGYVLIRSRDRMHKMFVLLGVIALLNGIVGTIQSRLSPSQVASWGPGYAERINGANGISGTTFRSEGEGHVRPLALGSDIGFGGGVGIIALPGTLALLAAGYGRGGRRWRRWLVPLLMLGALLAIATSLSRTAVLGGVFTLFAFGLFSLSAGRQMLKPLFALFVVMVLAIGLVTALSSTGQESTFTRYASISPENAAGTSTSYKEVSLKQIPKVIAQDPFGFGLGVSGASASFGGKTNVTLEGHGFSNETQWNFVLNEVGLPGLVLFVALCLYLIFLAATRLHTVRDIDARMGLAAIAAVVTGLIITGFVGAFATGQAGGPFFWFAAGTFAWWLLGPGRFELPSESAAGVPPGRSAPLPGRLVAGVS